MDFTQYYNYNPQAGPNGYDLSPMYQWENQAGKAWAAANNIYWDLQNTPYVLMALKQLATTPQQRDYINWRMAQHYKSRPDSISNAIVQYWDDPNITPYQVYLGVQTGNMPATQAKTMAESQAQAPIQNKVAGYTPSGQLDTTVYPTGGGGSIITPSSLISGVTGDPDAPGYGGTTVGGGAGVQSVGQTQVVNGVTYTITGFNTDGTPIWAGPGQPGGVSGGTTNNTGVTSGGSTTGSGVGGGTSTWNTMDTTPIDTINAQDITWRNLPSELFTFPFWREGMSGSTTTAGSTPGYTMQQPRYSPELFFPAAQQWGNWTPSERQAYQSAVQGTGASWDDVFEGLKKKWGVFTNTVQPSWAHTGGTFNWTPAGYSK